MSRAGAIPALAGVVEVDGEELQSALEDVLVPRLASVLRARGAGHCMRVTELDAELASRLVRRLRGAVANAEVWLLVGDDPADSPGVKEAAEVGVTSTKLVELRNRSEADASAPPLLVFVPPGLRASAEDSFSTATFEEVSVADGYGKLAASLLEDVPTALRPSVTALLDRLSAQHWEPANARARSRYLLALRRQDYRPEAAGAGVFELGLVPDFELFSEPAKVVGRVERNAGMVQRLTESPLSARQRVLSLGLADDTFAGRLANFAATANLSEPRGWTRRIAVDRENWGLSFGNWNLRESRSEPLGIDVQELPLPRSGDDLAALKNYPALDLIAGQPYLLAGQGGTASTAVHFQVSPDPRKVAGLKRFRIEILAENGDRVGVLAHTSVARTAKTEYKAQLTRLTKAEWEEGWYYAKVTPLDDADFPLDVQPGENGRPGGESERFYVVPDGSTDEPPERTLGHYPGVLQAMRALQFDALNQGREPQRIELRGVTHSTSGKAAQPGLVARFSLAGNVVIKLSPVLATLETAILSEPDRLGRRRLVTADAAAQALDILTDPAPEYGTELNGEARTAFAAFTEARTALFGAVCAAAASHSEPDTAIPALLEACDLGALHPEILAYADAYTTLCTEQLRRVRGSDSARQVRELALLRSLLTIDTADVLLRDAQGRRHTVLITSPTHPLRLLWLTTWGELGRNWIDRLRAQHGTGDPADVRNSVQDQAAPARDSLFERLRPLGYPFALPVDDGRLMVATQDLTAYWGAHLPDGCSDPRGLLSLLATALELPADSRTGVEEYGLSGAGLADRIERYIRLHPYVRTLVLNVVNAGRGELVADALLLLQKRPVTKDLHYDVRLCVTDPEEPEAGAALGALLRDSGTTTSAEADAFRSTAGGTLRPKLAYAVRSSDEFTERPEDFRAHLTVLVDAFGGERYGTALRVAAPAAAHGLVQELASRYIEEQGDLSGGGFVAWQRTPRHGQAEAINEDDGSGPLLGRLSDVISASAASVALGAFNEDRTPSLTLTLEAADRALLYHAHEVSDWVVTVDRSLGVEYFDRARDDQDSPEYIIDYAPGGDAGLGHRIMVSSRSVDELRSLLGPAAEELGVDVERRHTRTFFEQLRLLSGSLAFKLASVARNQRKEVVGLALARLVLEDQGQLASSVVVPLDAHPELYRDARKRMRSGQDDAPLRRTDLGLFHIDSDRRVLTCDLVEVKCYASLADLASYQRLRDTITEQLQRSQAVLAAAFDPGHTNPDRVDRAVKNVELGSMLRFYADRSRRHGTLELERYQKILRFADTLDDGYRLEFTRTGLIFDLSNEGIGHDLEHGVEFHRIGIDRVQELVNNIPTELPRRLQADEARPEAGASFLLTLPQTSQEALNPAAPDTANAPAGDAPSAVNKSAVEPGPSVTPAVQPPAQSKLPTDTPGPAAGDSQSVTQEAKLLRRLDPVAPSQPASNVAPTAPPAELPDIFLGVTGPSPQYGVLGRAAGRSVALDLDETHTISLFGIQGGGKSYTLGSIIEMATLPCPPVNELPHPLATIVFHYSQTSDYAPEFTSMVAPNDDARQLAVLKEQYGAAPKSLDDIVLIAPEAHLDKRREEYPGLAVHPLKFASSELQAAHWRFLMGAVGNPSTYIRQLTNIMRANRNDLSLAAIRQGVDGSGLPDHLKQQARVRLDLAAQYIDDGVRLQDLVRPGRLIIVDLRDDYIDQEEALGLFVVLMQLFAEARDGDKRFNKLVVFDEAHKYMESPDLVAGLVATVREMRHKGMSVLVASQDPPSVPVSLIELSNHVILHKITSPAWLKHLQKANAALNTLNSEQLARLTAGEGYVWSSKATDPAFGHGAVKLSFRPRVTRHGGATKTASGS
ncbi:methylation-associated defense system ATP-binding protein MAD8 [Streptomyces gibsoniae]|uniref:ATP-binding protein n=1 Tax=Streptomyces gibsoniae TaxID=3075529 RepID=A0ABU2U6F2_9ACTN|nr:hypothetical protein [Streptomyces sp. DSM 41699]MDT0468735.1 hypothetical protein [Streptomyces sp. DSM 41699]